MVKLEGHTGVVSGSHDYTMRVWEVATFILLVQVCFIIYDIYQISQDNTSN